MALSCQNALRGPYWIGTTRYDAPLPSGWLPGDTLIDNEIHRAKHPPLVGIVELTNRTLHGFSSRGVPQYLFYPLNAGYPPMIVGSKAPTTANQFGIVRFESWPDKSKWPHGALQELLGPVGDPATELRALRLRMCPRSKHETDPAFEADAALCGPNEYWDACFNIDPPGCRDVDDVVSWRYTKDGLHLEFGIHIANVAAWVPTGSETDLAAQKQGTTVYEEGTVLKPMLPAILSENKASLLADGKPRPVLSAIWRFNEVGVCLDSEPTWRPTQIHIQKAYTYDSVLEDPKVGGVLQSFLTGIWGSQVGPDPHRWIEVAMIAYNRAAAKRLQVANTGLLRRHKGALPSGAILKSLADQTGCAEIAWLGQAAGEYCAATEEDRAHTGLGESVYCHASSPLRRYADLVNQRVLLGLSLSEPQDELAFHLNQVGKTVRAWERDVWCLKHLNPSVISETAGWILGWKQKENEVRLLVFAPAWKRTVRIGFFNRSNMSESDSETDPKICVEPRDMGPVWIARPGQAVQIRAFCNLRAPQLSERFVFSCAAV